jgi:hypothetical protein
VLIGHVQHPVVGSDYQPLLVAKEGI